MPLNLDTSGTNPNNRIDNLPFILPSPQYRNFRCVISNNGPFYRNSHQVHHVLPNNSLVLLTEGVHYLLGHRYGDASKQTQRRIYGSVCIIDDSLIGSIRLSANFLGGNYTLTTQQVQNALMAISSNPRDISWEMLLNIPDAFPPGPHEHTDTDIAGIPEVIDGLQAIIAAINAQPIPLTPQTHNAAVAAINLRIDDFLDQLGNLGTTVSGSILQAINAAINALTVRVVALELFQSTLNSSILPALVDTLINTSNFVYEDTNKSKKMIANTTASVIWQNEITYNNVLWFPTSDCAYLNFVPASGKYKFAIRDQYSDTNSFGAPVSTTVTVDTGPVMTFVRSVSATDVIIEIHPLSISV